jgi:RNA polymerase sigma-70 factor (ECF subfamily)
MSLVARPEAPADLDRTLVERCTRGERAAQVELYRTEVQRVHAILHRTLGASSALEDLVQETFIRVFRSLGEFRGDAQLATWIGRIALNVAYDHLRIRRPATSCLEAVVDLEGGDPPAFERLAAREGLRRLYRILDRVEPRQRIAFTLHVIDGRPLAEVAALMSATMVATKTRVWRARRQVWRRARRDELLAGFVERACGGGS